jgi:hypothetical protein
MRKIRAVKTEPKERAPNLTEKDIAAIVSILDNWSGKLSWPLLIASVARQLRQTYTRQALFAHEQIAQGFSTKKELLGGQRGNRPADVSPELQAALSKIEAQEATIARLEKANQTLKEQFVRWTYNASTANLTQAFLDRPLPPVDRGQTPFPGSRKR